MPLRRLTPYGFIAVFLTVILTFLLYPLLTDHFKLFIFFQSFLIFMVLASIYTFSQHRLLHSIGILLFLIFLVFDAISFYRHSVEWMVAAYAMYAGSLLFAIVVLIFKILRSPQIDTNLIFGSITVYLLAGILWGKLFFLTDLIFPDSFRGIQQVSMVGENVHLAYMNVFEFIYYSFTTLTTLGVGDIIPVHRLAKSLTMLEAIFGQLFMATVIAKMVGIWRHKKED